MDRKDEKEMKNPKLNRFIGYVVLFIGFFVFYKGFHSSTVIDPVNGHDPFLIGISIVIIVASFIWMILKVRCPHCNALLDLKLRNIDKCPYCGKDT